jgi:hypothetical protein
MSMYVTRHTTHNIPYIISIPKLSDNALTSSFEYMKPSTFVNSQLQSIVVDTTAPFQPLMYLTLFDNQNIQYLKIIYLSIHDFY